MSRKVKDIDKGYKAIMRGIERLNGSYTKVGVQTGETTSEGDSLASIASYNEYGTEHIPSRPFMRKAFDKNKTQLIEMQKGAYNKVLNRTMDAKYALSIIGEWMQKQIVNEITFGNFVPNDPKTIRAKGSSKPLIDTGTLRSSIKHVEVMK